MTLSPDRLGDDGTPHAGTGAGSISKAWLNGTYAPIAPIFHGVRYWSYGHSFGVVQGSGATANAAAGSVYPARVRDLLHADTSLFSNKCVSGAKMQRIVQGALGSSETWTAGNYGLISLLGNQNDVGSSRAAVDVASYKNSLRAFLSLMRASSRIEESAGTFGGVWAGGASGGSWNQALASSSASAGAYAYTTNVGDTWTGTFIGTDASLLLVGTNDTTGAAYTVTVDGTQVASGTLSNQGNLGHVAVQLRNLSSALHTVVLTHTGTAGQTLAVDCLLPWAVLCPTVVVVKDVTSTSVGYARYASPPAATDVAAFNGYLDSVVAEFPSDGSIIVADPTAAWNPAIHTGPDGQHPNDLGMSVLTSAVFSALSTSGTWRRGLNYGVATSSVVPISDTFARADSATTLGTASTGQAYTLVLGSGTTPAWGISGGQAYKATGLQTEDLAVLDTGSANVDASITQAVITVRGSGLAFRVVDKNNYWCVDVVSGANVKLYKKVGGAFTQMADSGVASATGQVVRVTARGNVITLFINGAQVATVTDSANSAATLHGLRITEAGGGTTRLDNLILNP